MSDKKENSSVAIILLNYNSYELTIEALENLQKLDDILESGIIVVDNHSTNDSYDRILEWKLQHDKDMILLREKENRGYAAGNNAGMRIAIEKGYKYALIINNDLIFKDLNFIQKLKAVFEKDKLVGVVSPRIFTPQGVEVNPNLYRRSVWDMTLGGKTLLKKSLELVAELQEDYMINYRPQGCCMMVDLLKMQEIDFMDESTFLYVEEPILAERLMSQSYKSAYCRNASVVHNHSQTIQKLASKWKIWKWTYESNKVYWRKYRKFNLLQCGWCNVFVFLKFWLRD